MRKISGSRKHYDIKMHLMESNARNQQMSQFLTMRTSSSEALLQYATDLAELQPEIFAHNTRPYGRYMRFSELIT